ncbi:MAG TPA: cysteine-rich CWC family protein, partial [Comamonas sp.]
CAVAAGLPAETCWCMQSRIAPQALEKIPTESRGKACICAHCGQVSPTDMPSDT